MESLVGVTIVICQKRPKQNKNLPRFITKKSPSPIKPIRRKSPKPTVLTNRSNFNIPSVAIFSPERIYAGKENSFTPKLASTYIAANRRETFIVGAAQQTPEPVFEDSLEDTKPVNSTFERKMLSDSLHFTPTDKNFKPEVCSTDEKSLSTIDYTTGKRCIFPEAASTTFEINVSTETYVKNTSSDTYVKDISAETYVKNNLSSETFTKDLSLSGYELGEDVKTPPVTFSKMTRLESLVGSSAKNAIEANMWSNHKKKLSFIKEESSFWNNSFKPVPMKRKSDDITVIPPKRPNLDTKEKVIISDWTKTKTAPIIDEEMTEFLERQQDNIKKWLNAILVPSGLETDEKPKLDVTKLWRDIHKKKIEFKPENPVDFVDNAKLIAVRKQAKILYKSEDVQNVLNKINHQIDTNRLSVRADRDIHLDLSLQADIMNVLLSYNPLWLRIGLETIYGRTIPLRNNSDIVGLSTFLSQCFIRNAMFLKRFKSVHASSYVDAIKKYILKKFLALVYFLDVAKTQKIFLHDPCLFRRNAPIKESREALLGFSRQILSSMGDVTKYLKHYNYIVTHKQNYLDEFDYTVTSLITDLRDGVRLTRVLEIILLEPNLRNNLRVPAISRLQKVFNTKLVFDVLAKRGFELMYDITHKDIVDGYKEKTLCFLWQIIYKFQTPLMAKSVTIIATWWRSEAILLKRAELRRIREEREAERRRQLKQMESLVIKVQSCVRMFIARRRYKTLKYYARLIEEKIIARKLMQKQKNAFEQIKYASIVIQRRYRAQTLAQAQFNEYQKLKQSTILVQKIFHANKQRRQFTTLKNTVIFVQRKYRAKLAMLAQLKQYQILKANCIIVQRRFRANVEMRKQLYFYEILKRCTIFVQRRFRANRMALIERTNFEVFKYATLTIQRWFRASIKGKQVHEDYLKLKGVTMLLQRRWRAKLLGRKVRAEYLELKQASLVIQRRYRANLLQRMESTRFMVLKMNTVMVQRYWRSKIETRVQRNRFLELKRAAINVQQQWRAIKLGKCERQNFTELKRATLIIQERFRANRLRKFYSCQYRILKCTTIVIQRFWRAKIRARNQRRQFLELKKAVCCIQQRWRAVIVSRNVRHEYLQLQSASLVIQRRFRALLAQRKESKNFSQIKQSIVVIQRFWRAKTLGKAQRQHFLKLKNSANIIQQRYRASVAQRIESSNFERLKQATIFVQRFWRAKIQTRIVRSQFERLKIAAITIQKQWRSRQVRKEYVTLKWATVILQQRFRAKLAQKAEALNYKTLKQVTIFLQTTWRRKIIARLERNEYVKLRTMTVLMQRRFRAKLQARVVRQELQQLYRATIFVQRKWRANKLATIERNNFDKLKWTSLIIQRRFRAKLAQRLEQSRYQSLKSATIYIQRQWRSKIIARHTKQNFALLKMSVVLIQRKYRAVLAQRLETAKFRALKGATIVLQNRWRALKAGRVEREKFEQLKRAAVVFQRRYRAKVAQQEQSSYFKALKAATICVQRRWRAKLEMRIVLQNFVYLKASTILVQRKFRANRSMKFERRKYEKLRGATLSIQMKWRAVLLGRAERECYLELRSAVLKIQRRFRANLAQKVETGRYKALKEASIFVQRMWKGKLKTRIERRNYLILKNSALIVQRSFRAYLEMKNYRKLRNTVILVQRKWREKVSARLRRREEELLKEKQSRLVQRLQPFLKGYLVRQKYQDFLSADSVAERKLLRVQSQAATKIQAVWRGYKNRVAQTPKLLQVYENLKKANQCARPEETLGARCQKACLLLQENYSISVLMKVFEDFDFITRRCPVSLIHLSKRLPKILYKIIAATNRSPAEIEVCTSAASILINMYKYPKTRESTWLPEVMESVITVMLRFCDKEYPLFPTLATLFWFFLQNEDYKQVIMKTVKFQEKMQQIQVLCERKAKMISKIDVSYKSYFAHYKNLPVPSMTPDWGLDYPTRPRFFLNSCQALKCIISQIT